MQYATLPPGIKEAAVLENHPTSIDDGYNVIAVFVIQQQSDISDIA